MTDLRRILCIAFLVFGLTAACGDDEESTPTTIPTTTGATTRAASPTTVPVTTAQAATDGAICPAAGARGVTREGLNLVCTAIAGQRDPLASGVNRSSRLTGP